MINSSIPPLPHASLDDWLRYYTKNIQADQPYRPPTAQEVADFIGVLRLLLKGQITSSLFAPLGYEVWQGADEHSGRHFVLLSNVTPSERAWGAYLFDAHTLLQQAPLKGVIEAPHPVFDEATEAIALELWRTTQGTALLLSGSHRTDTTFDNPRDVAHQTSSLFHQVAMEFSHQRLPQFQQHGFADVTDAAHDIILSTGDSAVSPAIVRLAASLEVAGFRVARNWDDTATTLLGIDNAQGAVAESSGSVFAHVEVNHTVRTQHALQARYIRAVRAARFFDSD